MRLQMRFDFLQFITIQMNQPSAFFTLAMEVGGAFLLFRAYVFIAGAVARFQQVLAYCSFRHKPFDLPVNGSGADGLAKLGQLIPKLGGCVVDMGVRFQIGNQLILLPGMIRGQGKATPFGLNLKIILILTQKNSLSI